MSTSSYPTAALLIIGAEVLSGKVQDANGPFLIHALRQRGIEVIELRVVGDIPASIAAAVNALRQSADVVLTTGGVGPTHDDVTMHSMSLAFNAPLVAHPEITSRLQNFYAERLTDIHRRMALIPAGSLIHTAPETLLPVVQKDNVFIFPGIPQLVERGFVGIVDALPEDQFFNQTLLLDVYESQIADLLTKVQTQFPDVTIGSYPRLGATTWKVKITIDGRQQDMVAKVHAVLTQQLDPSWLVEPAA